MKFRAQGDAGLCEDPILKSQIPAAIDRLKYAFSLLQMAMSEGNSVSLDGNTGAVHAGRLALVTEKPERALRIIAGWRHAGPSKRKLAL